MVDKIKIRADLTSKEDKSNKVTSLSSNSTDSQYPSAKAVYDTIQNLDTGGVGINDYYFDTTTKEIVLDYERSSGGSGGGSYVDIVTEWEQNPSDEKVASEKLTKDSLDLKADSTHTHSQYLTEHQSLTNYVQKESGKGLFSGSYADLTNKPSYTATVTSSTSGAYKIGSINISGTNVDIYGKDTDTHQSLTNYVQKSSTTGLLKNDGTVDTTSYATSSQISSMLTTSDVVDNLTSTSSTAPLSAKQGKALNDLIGQAITYINQ